MPPDRGRCRLSGVDIVREAPDGEQTTILHRSPLLNIYQDYQIIFWAIAFAALATACIARFIANSREVRQREENARGAK